MFRFILSFFFKPFNKKIKNKTRSSIFAPLKFSLKFIGGFVLLCTLVVVCVDVMSGVNPNAGDKVTIKRVKSKNKEGLYENNPNGTVNGLNLMLINNITTEGYVKEYLTIAKMSEEGKLDDLPMHATVSSILGTQIAEGNTMFGGILPKTFLPHSDDEQPYWGDNNPYGVKGSLFNLTNADYNFYTDGGGSVPTSDIGRGNSTGTYYGPFQQTPTYFGLYGGHYPAANLHPQSKSSGRPSDPFYFPDQVVGLSYELSENKKRYSGIDLDASQLSTLLSVRHNAGSGALSYQILFGVHWNKGNLLHGNIEEEVKSINLLFKDLSESYEKYRSKLTRSISDHLWKFIGMLMLLEQDGWYIDPNRNYDYVNPGNSNNITQSYMILHPEITDSSTAYSKAIELINGKTKTFVSPTDSSVYGRASGPAAHGGISPIVYKIRQETSTNYAFAGSSGAPIVNEIPIETVGHMYSTTYAGDYMYALMLKYAGVDVDPTDPNSYMNNIPEGEWKPSGDTAWMDQYGIKPSEIGPKRTAVLNEGYKWLGSLYTQYNGNADGSQKPPQKDENGNWIDRPYENGFDCSGYMQYIFRTALGIDITRTTYSQYPNVDNMEFIDESEAKPGDLIYYFYPGDQSTEHVSMYLGKDSTTGLDIIMHAPYFGERLKITTWNGYPGTRRVFKRVKGID